MYLNKRPLNFPNVSQSRISAGREFHAIGPLLENAASPALVLDLGTTKSLRFDARVFTPWASPNWVNICTM